jgi:hypothetical protein
MARFISLHVTSTGMLCELDSMNNRVYSGMDAVMRVGKGAGSAAGPGAESE